MNSFLRGYFLRYWLMLLLGANALLLHAAPNTNDLKKINDEIHLTQKNINVSEKKHNALSADLAKAETSLSKVQSKKNAIQADIKQQNLELKELQQQETELNQQRLKQQQMISDQLNASYRLGHEKNIKMLLNQDDSHAVSRSMAYSDYLTQSRLNVLQSYQKTLADLDETRKNIHEKIAQLKTNEDDLAEKAVAIKSSYQERNAILQQLKSSIDSDKNKVTQLQRNQEQLQNLLKKIRLQQEAAQKAERLAQQEQARRAAQQANQNNNTNNKPTPQAPVNSQLAFAQNKGRLPWPTTGKLVNHFGERRPSGEFRWQGATFLAPQGNNVRSVFTGKVVFAEWFRGKGLLIIIDHGGGYMTLYAHNETLLKKAGDQVITGENIATVGDSGGLTSPELYFELRLQGEPLNPGNWLGRNNG